MKLSLTQIILGVLIIFAACYVTGWMIHEAPHQLTQPLPNIPKGMAIIETIQENEALFNLARYGSLALPVLGALVLVIGTIQSVKAGTRTWRLITINIIAGVLITALAFVIGTWGYPTIYYTATLEGSDTLIKISTLPVSDRDVALAIGVTLLLGLAVVGVSIAQIVKSQKTQNI